MNSDVNGGVCSRPFEHFEVQCNGDVYLCCPAWLPVPAGSLKKSSVKEIWNSAAARMLRESVLTGTYRHCRRDLCGWLQTGLAGSRRDKDGPCAQAAGKDGPTWLARGPVMLVLDNDRTCNLWCPSCRTQRFVLQGREYEESRVMQEKIIREGLDNARALLVSGSGDPFASRLHTELLAGLDGRRYPQLGITLMTNGQLFSPLNWARLENIHGMVKNVLVSVDAATAETYRVLRRGGEFARLMENLAFITGLRKQGIIERLELHFVVQQRNYGEMDGFIRLARDLGADMVNFSRLVNWGTFGEEEYRKKAVHLPDHPEHRDFLRVIAAPLYKGPFVSMSNLSVLLKGQTRGAGG